MNSLNSCSWLTNDHSSNNVPELLDILKIKHSVFTAYKLVNSMLKWGSKLNIWLAAYGIEFRSYLSVLDLSVTKKW